MDRVETIINIARECAKKTPHFLTIKGEGEGDRATYTFMKDLKTILISSLSEDYSEKRICGNNKLAVDFYIPEESTIIEIALSLRNSNSEFERDILKALIAKKYGYKVDRLVFLSKPGAKKKHEQASSKEIISWAKANHNIKIEIFEFTH